MRDAPGCSRADDSDEAGAGTQDIVRCSSEPPAAIQEGTLQQNAAAAHGQERMTRHQGCGRHMQDMVRCSGLFGCDSETDCGMWEG
jgi:hypothetical protein